MGQIFSATRRYMATQPLIPMPAAGQRSLSARSRFWRQEYAEAARQAAAAARGRENELTRPRDMGMARNAQLVETSEPKSDNGGRFVLEDLVGDQTDDDPEALAIFSRQFRLDDDSVDASQPAVPAPKRRPSSSASSIGPSRPKRVCIRTSTSGAFQPAMQASALPALKKPSNSSLDFLPDLDLRGLLPYGEPFPCGPSIPKRICIRPSTSTASQPATPASVDEPQSVEYWRTLLAPSEPIALAPQMAAMSASAARALKRRPSSSLDLRPKLDLGGLLPDGQPPTCGPPIPKRICIRLSTSGDSIDESQSVGYWRTLLAPSEPIALAPKMAGRKSG